jgi:predicted esterase
VESKAHPSVEGFFEPPFYSWVDQSAEVGDELTDSVLDVMEMLYETVEEEGPFDGVIGFSQGATIACWFVLHHALKKPLDPPFALFKFCLLFGAAGMPELLGVTLDSDKLKEAKIGIPSLHVCGQADEILDDSLALMKRCEDGTAELLLHKFGHTVPKDAQTVDRIMKGIDRVYHRAIFM